MTPGPEPVPRFERREAQVEHPMAVVKAIEDSRVEPSSSA
jgi:hypothetical protein